MASTTWRGNIAFGMVSIPVRLHKAARRERIRFHHVYRPEPVEAEPPAAGPRLVEPDEAGPVERVRSVPPIAQERIFKGVEWERDRYVVFDREEIAALKPKTSSELAIQEFVLVNEIDPVFFDTSYYVEPDRGSEKPYAVLYMALSDSGYVALGTFAMHGREHAAVVRPGKRGLILHTLFYANEVRAEGEYAVDAALAGSKEHQLAVTLVEALAAPFEPEKLKNEQEERLRALIESRAEKAVPAAGTEPVRPPIDILEALRKSLAAAKKPATSETRTSAPPAKRSRRK